MQSLRKFRPAVVDEVFDKKVAVTLNKKEMKSICAEKGCTVCNHNFPQTKMTLPRNQKELKKGDSIVISMIVLNEALGAFIAFILPLLVAILFYLLVTKLLYWGGNEGKTVGGTLIILLFSLWGVSGIDKLIQIFFPAKIAHIEKNE